MKCKVWGCYNIQDQNGYCEEHCEDIRRAEIANKRFDLKEEGLDDDEIDEMLHLQFDEDLNEDFISDDDYP